MAAEAPPLPTGRDPVALGNELLAANPDLRRLLADEAKAGVAARFFPLYRALSLSEVQIAEFEQMILFKRFDPSGANMPGRRSSQAMNAMVRALEKFAADAQARSRAGAGR